jgi:tRNA(fMet)-specific endonuclease VapC
MSLVFMLDTDTVSYALRGQGRVADVIGRHRPSALCVSAITMAQLRFGAMRRKSAKLDQMIEGFTENVAVVPFEADCAFMFGRIASQLEDLGTPIGEFDALIAAHAMSLGLTLVTNNVKHFSRVAGLNVENWLR